MRKFEKIGFEQFKKDIKDDQFLYDNYLLPKRGTIGSAGYDFHLLEDVIIEPGKIYMTPTGIKVRMHGDEVLLIIIRSSLGFKKGIILPNQVGVIDSDYYNNVTNEGHIFVPIKNTTNEVITLKANDKFAQGIFTKFLTVDDEENLDSKRTGGFGSTNIGGKHE